MEEMEEISDLYTRRMNDKYFFSLFINYEPD